MTTYCLGSFSSPSAKHPVLTSNGLRTPDLSSKILVGGLRHISNRLAHHRFRSWGCWCTNCVAPNTVSYYFLWAFWCSSWDSSRAVSPVDCFSCLAVDGLDWQWWKTGRTDESVQRCFLLSLRYFEGFWICLVQNRYRSFQLVYQLDSRSDAPNFSIS